MLQIYENVAWPQLTTVEYNKKITEKPTTKQKQKINKLRNKNAVFYKLTNG